MKESAKQFAARTGLTYDPPAWLRARARALAPDESCPTLYRFPGPCGLRDLFKGSLASLGFPGDEGFLLSDAPIFEDVPGAAHFGTLAVLQPLRLSPCQTERPNVFHAANSPLDAASVAWLPPANVLAPIDLDQVATAEELERRLPAISEARRRTAESLERYLEEVAALERSGAPERRARWCDLDEDSRLRQLAECGVSPVWSSRSR